MYVTENGDKVCLVADNLEKCICQRLLEIFFICRLGYLNVCNFELL